MTEPSLRKPGPTFLFWILMLALVVATVLFAPLFDCPTCKVIYDVTYGAGGGGCPRLVPYPRFSTGCEQCWHGRVGLYRRWKQPQL
jgi:hypothetical protein